MLTRGAGGAAAFPLADPALSARSTNTGTFHEADLRINSKGLRISSPSGAWGARVGRALVFIAFLFLFSFLGFVWAVVSFVAKRSGGVHVVAREPRGEELFVFFFESAMSGSLTVVLRDS